MDSHTAESAYDAGLVDALVPTDEQAAWVETALGLRQQRLLGAHAHPGVHARPDVGSAWDEVLRARRGLWARRRDDGMLRVVALLPPEEGALLLAALEAVAGSEALPRPAGDPALEPWAARRADALCAIGEHALAAGPEGLAAASDATQVVVHVDVGVLTGEQPDGRCHLEDGTPLSAAAARRLGCDADVVAIVEKDGLPIDVGRRRRLFTGKQRRALQARDRTCRYPGCQVPARRTRAHHLLPWWEGGGSHVTAVVC